MEEKEMNKSFYELVKKVRRNQKSYFATQDRKFLNEELRPMEAELDTRLKTEKPTLQAAQEFRKAVWQMRGWQARFFATYTAESRDNSIKMEKYVDKWILKTEEFIKERQQPKLQFEE